jgi:glyoxylase-like metal-dependent hydrolase (beta-lactamase superfamily II)
MSTARIEKTVVSGVFSLDGQDFDVDNNVWLIGDDDEVLVIDAPHDAAPIVEAIGGRRVTAIVLTHGHNDHTNAAVDLREATGAPIWFNAADLMLWKEVRSRLMTLPWDTVVRTGHGADTTIGAEVCHVA